MERIRNGMIELRAEGETLDIDLEHFEWRDQAILLEHLGQFLTPEQQTKHGRRWSQLYAERITVPKPKRIDAREQFLSIWRLGCIVAGCCILFAPLLLELSVRGEGFTLAQIPEMREMLYTMLIVCSLGPLGLLSVFGMLMIPAFYHKHIQRVGIGAMVKVGWLVKESQIRQLFWKYGISRCLPHNL